MPRVREEDPNYEIVMRMFGRRCILCNREENVTVHEIVPRSLAPKTWKEVGNRAPLCQECHDWVHRLSSRERNALLLPARKRALRFYTS